MEIPEAVQEKYLTYPVAAQRYFLELRQMILDTAANYKLGRVEETLKWGEPSYNTSCGSPVRIDWKSASPDCISLYFNCNTKLVETFRELYGVKFDFGGNREIRLPLQKNLPLNLLSECCCMALRYHHIKQLPLLGYGAQVEKPTE
ncbi:DUF1801 domain-containing protein [Teredinibacter turnerae]|uniref:DUF1801 domain-containing protein n=1 Tax=Teredinibacter turnerae TaxID=2426 RepID=UPI00035ED3DC|nr:DUF1801 domain-containing protein [Teredinibacter turnerae]